MSSVHAQYVGTSPKIRNFYVQNCKGQVKKKLVSSLSIIKINNYVPSDRCTQCFNKS